MLQLSVQLPVLLLLTRCLRHLIQHQPGLMLVVDSSAFSRLLERACLQSILGQTSRWEASWAAAVYWLGALPCW